MGRNQAVRRQDPRSRQQTRLQSDRNPAQPVGNRQQSSDRLTSAQPPLSNSHQGFSKTLLSGSIRLFRRYPLLLVLAVWLVFLLLASIAIANMMNLDASKRSSAAPLSPLTDAPSAVVPVPAVSAPDDSSASARHQGEGLPLLSLMAIALTCATGCIVLLRCLQPRRPAKQLQPLTARSTAAGKSRRISPEVSRFQSAPSAGSPKPVEASLVPQEVNQPLDWDEPSLADSLDLRQRQPLSRWLQSD